jgi:hypothetical protein
VYIAEDFPDGPEDSGMSYPLFLNYALLGTPLEERNSSCSERMLSMTDREWAWYRVRLGMLNW